MIKEVYFTEVKWKPTHDNLGGVSGKIVFKKPVSYQDYLSISRKEYLLLDENKDKEIERLNKERKAIKKYVHNHTITYIDNGIECCKPDEYFNISWVEDMLDGNFENLEVLFEDSDKE